MAMRRIMMFSVIVVLVMLIVISINMKQHFTDKAVLSSWLWDKYLKEDVSADLYFAVEQGVEQLYGYVPSDVDEDNLETFVSEANELGIDVYALQGQPNWVTNIEKARTWLSFINQYNRTSSSPFAGVIFDVEPYLLEGWDEEQTLIVSQFMALFDQLQEDNADLQLKWTIPFWFDRVEATPTQTLAEYMIERADEISVMAYRDELNGHDGLLAHINEEIKWAEQYKTPLAIIIETRQADNEKVSFYGEKQKFEHAIIELRHVADRYEYVDEVSIHHLHTWEQLIKESQ
ncbi:hypothetical protein [Bacillus solimangrovi]|uniref:Amidase n=1 Tax=Bacillus solimangrovi TaxID=1305675 RepID=A0A1E5LJU9_9BACI|nr:hypothetical protein [Bacillus solimangrovi]OEH94298.1 hypothetical protein BFG57_08560 [Bacillus solimangrovi]